MLLRIWNYLRGYVIVEASGFAMERFMNLVISHNIYLWNVKKENGKLYFCIGIKDFKLLKPYAKKAHCRLKIKYKKGMPFKVHQYRGRTMFGIGMLLFVGLIWLMSSFVWLIDVEGNKKINSIDIISTLEKQGYSVGSLKHKLDLRAAEAYLINQYPEIIWTGIKFQGTRLVVQVSEMVPKPQMYDDNSPCDLVAKRDALITYIATYKGMPQVKKGDIVKKGDLLVAGQMPLGVDDPNFYFTKAKAQVRGKTIYHLEGDYPLEQVVKKYTHSVSKKYSLKVFNKRLTLFNPKVKFASWETVITSYQLSITKFFPLPFAFEKEERLEYVPMKMTISEEEAQDKLTGLLWDHLSEKLSKDAVILKRDIVFSKKGNAIHARLNILAEEDIGYAVKLQGEGES